MTASIHPGTATAGETGTWTVRIVLDHPLPVGGTIRVQLPRSWHTTELNQAKGVHSLDPTAANYVGLRCEHRGAHLAWCVEGGTTARHTGVNTRVDLRGHEHRYNYVVRVWVVEGDLPAGTPVEVIFGDRRGGGPGFVAGLHPAGDEPVGITVDRTGAGDAEPLAGTPTVAIRPAPLHEITLVAPSEATAGGDVRVAAVGLDAYRNPVPLRGPLALRILEGHADAVDELPGGRDFRREWLLRGVGEGVLRVEARLHRLAAVGNPTLCAATAPAQRTYWGDLHSHARDSYDATGADPFGYARDVACLDFYALTEHTEGWGRQGRQRWAAVRAAVAAHHQPGRFVTLHAYESTLDAPYGHHNVFFRDDPGDDVWPLVSRDRGGTLDALWASLTAGEALTVPHHTGIAWPGRGDLAARRNAPVVDWSIRHDVFRTLVEIYSGHGQSEVYDPHHPAAYERMSDWSLSSFSTPGPHYARDGWLSGQRLGVVAGSDNHTGQPGQTHTGLTALVCTDLRRDTVFDAMVHRRAYATTGARIRLRFGVDGQPMGSALTTPGPHRIAVSVLGTDDLATVELIRGDLDAGTLATIRTWQPEGMRFEAEHDDDGPAGAGFYYVRVRQAHPVRGRAVLAWSSPVWCTA